jgi:formate-dependent nitrite reductase cytochrome c552 subunit
MKVKKRLFGLFLIPLAALMMLAGQALAQDRTEAEGCKACHFYPGSVVMPFTVDTYYESSHANSYLPFLGNTYCAECHSPFQADPDATHSENAPVLLDNWEAVTCGSCHPPHDLRVEWGTPIGNYDVETAEWTPVYEEEADLLCEYCHGDTHFQGFGQSMSEHKDVTCSDCHMPKVPNTNDEGRMTRTHNWKVYENTAYSCGTVGGGCHENHKTEWAEKQILKEKIHAVKSNNGSGND